MRRSTTVGGSPQFHTGEFVKSLFTQTPIIHVIRTNKIPFIQSLVTWPLILTSAIVVAAGAWLTLLPLVKTLRCVPLPPQYSLLLVIMLPAARFRHRWRRSGSFADMANEGGGE